MFHHNNMSVEIQWSSQYIPQAKDNTVQLFDQSLY